MIPGCVPHTMPVRSAADEPRSQHQFPVFNLGALVYVLTINYMFDCIREIKLI